MASVNYETPPAAPKRNVPHHGIRRFSNERKAFTTGLENILIRTVAAGKAVSEVSHVP